ncbi:LysR family transcriptional regulator [Testudinibacter sp. TR-2022]|uniref:LysR family transcriptional regulator n=1 Tax=Testudinibacter sp. TR-2022 TaxID=2585029 RepID=UPI00111AB68E|nr:LysR family transcriptional regulator [Testudinibacter sp. TR-2022]TNH09370.1 LysR family transcriptional regulator [Pasteurellaceae bacterium Phil11]TNH20730.1 LysR family transcriptional regulator [Testudinibacter sp. TR-2022]TNH29396.1 LysR family transcriptional regulator [Testudinibacter sp. TR-2022]
MQKTGLTELQIIMSVAELGGFRAAATALEMSPSALSHAVSQLEGKLGARLFNRTTRSVTLSAAGLKFIERVKPAMAEIEAAMAEAGDANSSLSGTLRINTAERAAQEMLEPIIIEYLRRYPQMHIDLVSDGRLIDIVADGFDAGFRLAEAVPQDMVSIPLGADIQIMAVCSPDYLARHGAPQTPHDLYQHACIRYRFTSGKLFRWEFEHGGEQILIDANGPLTLDSPLLMAEAALSGIGIAFVYEGYIRDHLAGGRLVQLLPDWTPKYAGLCLYYPRQRHVSAALRAFIDLVQESRAVFAGQSVQ